MVVVAILGAYLAWTLIAAEILYIPATTDDMPRFLARTNRSGAPVAALIMAGALIQLLLILLLVYAAGLSHLLAVVHPLRGRRRAERHRGGLAGHCRGDGVAVRMADGRNHSTGMITGFAGEKRVHTTDAMGQR